MRVYFLFLYSWSLLPCHNEISLFLAIANELLSFARCLTLLKVLWTWVNFLPYLRYFLSFYCEYEFLYYYWEKSFAFLPNHLISQFVYFCVRILMLLIQILQDSSSHMKMIWIHRGNKGWWSVIMTSFLTSLLCKHLQFLF